MKIIEVIERRYYHHKPTGRRASIYGSCPWYGEADKADWEMVTSGFTWSMSNGTIGFGRPAAKTREEAEEIMKKFNNHA